jgi:hypothetical protein
VVHIPTRPIIILWILSLCLAVYGAFLSPKPGVFILPDFVEENLLFKMFIAFLAVVIYLGFMQSSVKVARKMLKKDATKSKASYSI